jgi:hypothetical protein
MAGVMNPEEMLHIRMPSPCRRNDMNGCSASALDQFRNGPDEATKSTVAGPLRTAAI